MENKNEIWFKAKEYGWGWYPATWQGWMVIFLYAVFVALHFKNVDRFASSAIDVFSFLVPFIINTVFLLIISHAKGEKPKWRWGEK